MADVELLQAENDRLRAEVERLRRLVQERDTMLGKRLCAGTNADGKPRCLVLAEERARADRLAEACERLARKWERQADEHGVRQFTGNDHRLFAKELRAALAQEDRNG